MCYTNLINETEHKKKYEVIRCKKPYPDEACFICHHRDKCWKNSGFKLDYFF